MAKGRIENCQKACETFVRSHLGSSLKLALARPWLGSICHMVVKCEQSLKTLGAPEKAKGKRLTSKRGLEDGQQPQGLGLMKYLKRVQWADQGGDAPGQPKVDDATVVAATPEAIEQSASASVPSTPSSVSSSAVTLGTPDTPVSLAQLDLATLSTFGMPDADLEKKFSDDEEGMFHVLCSEAQIGGQQRVALDRQSSSEVEPECIDNEQAIKDKVKMDALKEAMDLNTFPMNKHPAGYAWSREVAQNMQLKADYDAVGKQQKAQQAFRKEWARKEYSKLVAKHKVKKDTYEEIDQSIGEYLTIAEIFEKEGGNSTNPTIRRDGIKATVNYLKFCLERSHFCAWSEATKRCDFLRLSRRWFKNWRQEWTLKTVIEMSDAEKQVECGENDKPGNGVSAQSTAATITSPQPKAKIVKKKSVCDDNVGKDVESPSGGKKRRLLRTCNKP